MPNILDLPVSGGLVASQVPVNAWHPTNTDWKYFFSDFDGATDTAANPAYTAFPSGTLSAVAIRGGVATSRVVLDPPADDRIGVLELSSGTSVGAGVGFESHPSDSFAVYGKARLRFGMAFRFVDMPGGTEDYDTYIGFSENIGPFAAAATYLMTDINTSSNFQVWGKGSSSLFTDTGVAVDTNWHNFEVDVAGDLSWAKYYIDGVLVHTETNSIYIPTLGTKASFNNWTRVTAATISNRVHIDWAYVGVKPNNPRGTVAAWTEGWT